MSNDDELKAKSTVDSWYWQMAEGHNFRWKNAVKSMVLFYESAPLESDMAQLVIEYLRTRAGVTQLLIAHKPWTFAEPGWNTKDAWYQTVPSEQWAGTESKKVRVYWVLAQAGDGEADGPYTVENGCKYRVTHSYYWDVAGEPQLPASSSGVQYSIQGFTRDRETGLYTFIVERRETVEQTIPLYESAKTIFETVSEQQFLGVKQGSVAGKGLPASVGNGERVERHISKNPDCTSDVTNRKIKDTKVEQARTVARKELRGTSAAVTDRNLTPVEVAAKTSAPQEVGETRTVEKTDTDLRNLTVEKFEPGQLPMTLAESCERETSVHTDTKVEAVMQPVADGTVEQTAEPNKRKTVTVRKNDDGMTADKTTVTQTWEEKTGGGSSNSGGGVVTTTTERKENTTSTPSASPGVNKVVEIDEQPNDHGSKTTVKRVTEYHEKTGGGSSNSGNGVVTSTTERKENTVTTPAATPGVNKVVEIEETPNDHGSKTTLKRITEYHEKTGGGSSNSGGGIVTSTTERKENTTSTPVATPGVNKVVEIEETPNDHGSKTTLKRVTEYHEKTGGGSSNSGGVVSSVTERKENTTASPAAGASAVNVVIETDELPNDHGSKTTLKRTTTYSPTTKTKTWSDEHYTYSQCAYSNQPEPLQPSTGETISLSFHPNGHGSYDGGWTTRAAKSSGGVVTLAWEKTISGLTSKYFYFNKEGKLCYRTFTCATAYYCYGPYRSCYNKVYESAGNPPENCAHVGWISGVRISGSDKAFGQRFSGISAGSEVVVDQGGGGSSQS